MKYNPLRRLRLLGFGALLTPLLTACPPVPPPPLPGFSLSFSYPDGANTTGLTLAAIYFPGPGDGRLVGTGGYSGYNNYSLPAASKGSAAALKPATSPVYPSSGAPTTLYVDGYSLQSILNSTGAPCRSFQDDAAAGMQQVTVTPPDVKTCYVYFVAFKDVNGDRLPQSSEEVYSTHDVLANASSDFSYTAVSADGKSRESGSLKTGWTVVRHTVLQPSAAPGQFLVSMASVSTADQGVAIRMHEPSDYLTSMSLTVTGGAK